MSFGSILFTSKGSALQAKATAGTALVFTKIVMGSGYLNGQSQIALTDVIEPKITLSISEIKRNGERAVIKANFSNESSAIGFYLREIGLYATDPDLGEILYCYGNAGTLAEYIPPESSQLIEKVISIVAVVGNATSVSAVIDSTAFATKADFETYTEQVSDFSAQLAQKLAIGSDYRPGILINDNFLINQRGKSSYSGTNIYTVDQWMMQGATLVTPYATGGIGIQCNTASDQNLITQPLEKCWLYSGKTLTLSMKYKNLSIGTNTRFVVKLWDGVNTTFFKDADITKSSDTISLTATISSNPTTISATLIKIGTGSTFSVDIDWIKLEVNDHATPYIPKLPDNALRECQKYCLRQDIERCYRMSTYNANVLTFFIPTPVTLRTNPTIATDANSYMGIYTVNGTYTNGWSSQYVSVENGIYATFTKVGHGMTDAVLVINHATFEAVI